MIEKNYAPLTGVTRVVLAIAMAGSCAFAQSETTETAAPVEETELPAMTVSANDGAPIALEDVGVSVTVLNVEDLKKEGVYSLSNALTEVPGVAALPGGGLNQQGNVSNISMRGQSGENYILPTLDGMRLGNSNTTLASNIFARTNLFNIGTLEVLRGSQAAVYGGGAIGGVVYMETPQGQGDPSVELFNEYGSFDTYTGSLTAQGQEGKLSFFLNASYQRTNNDFKTASGDKFSEPHAGKSEIWQETIRLDYQQNEDNKTTVTYRREDSEFKYATRSTQENWAPVTPGDWGGAWAPDGTFSTADTYYDYAFMSNMVTLKHESQITEKYSSSLMAGYFGNDNSLDGGFSNQLRNVQIEWRNSYEWNKANKTKAGFAWNRSEYRQDSTDQNNGSHSLDNIYGFYVDHQIKPNENWDTNLTARLDSSSNFNELFTLRAASNYKFNNNQTRAFASIGTGYDTPSQMEIMKGQQTWGWINYVGNPDLETSSSVSFDFGLEQKIADDHKITATYFWIQEEDAIYSETQGWDTTFKNANGHSLSQGVELSASGILEKDWNTSYTLAYTYTQAKMPHDEASPNSARQVWSLDINTSPNENLTLGAGLCAALGRVDHNGENLDNYYVARLYANYKYSENLSFHIRIENLTDQKFVTESVYSVNPGDNMINAGAGIYGGFTIKF